MVASNQAINQMLVLGLKSSWTLFRAQAFVLSKYGKEQTVSFRRHDGISKLEAPIKNNTKHLKVTSL